jgi:hypothetical protein
LNFNCIVYTCLIEVNATDSIATIIQEINDSGWIKKLDLIDQLSYGERIKNTSKIIFDKCSNCNSVTKTTTYDYSIIGEYIISKEGRSTLINQYGHKFVPLAELWKEKDSGNPGFDFHSETCENIIVFGEAKYNSSANPYSDAINQVEDFIRLKKDVKEMSDLKHFVSSEAQNNFINSKKGFAISFSIKAKDPFNVLNNVIHSTDIIKIADFNEFYIIGVIINDK